MLFLQITNLTLLVYKKGYFKMNKNLFAPLPPMGWNSYDYYDTTVTEQDIKANADYMATHLLPYGWDTIVVDIEWYSYDTGTQRDKHQYIPFWKVEMDEYSRLLPCIERFPSAANNQGFRPLADYVHNLGLKFGIHIMRGIPRTAAHEHRAILNCSQTANEIADPSNICFWNPDMYGVRPEEIGAQAYYNSIFQLYAEWGVDFVKCDDICRMDMPSAKAEIKMLHDAIQACGRPMILSLSPGPAKIEEAWYYETYANMWRITDDLWDNWCLVRTMFDRCELWQNHVSSGCYPDCDMLPLGTLGKGFREERQTRLTHEEQKSMMTLWCIFRSPMMLGCELTKLDDMTLSLLTNKEVLGLLSHSEGARQLLKNDNTVIWQSKDTLDESSYLAIFNLEDQKSSKVIFPELLSIPTFSGIQFKELWTKEEMIADANALTITLPAHGACLYQYKRA